jgi:hypothetical protein
MGQFETDLVSIATKNEVRAKQADRARDMRKQKEAQIQRERAEIAARYSGSFLVRVSQASRATYVVCATSSKSLGFAVNCHTHGVVTYSSTRTGVDDIIREPVCKHCRAVMLERYGWTHE